MFLIDFLHLLQVSDFVEYYYFVIDWKFLRLWIRNSEWAKNQKILEIEIINRVQFFDTFYAELIKKIFWF